MSGADENDATCMLPPTAYVPTPGNGLAGLTVGIPAEYHIEGLSPSVLGLWRQGESWLAEAGASARVRQLRHHFFFIFGPFRGFLSATPSHTRHVI